MYLSNAEGGASSDGEIVVKSKLMDFLGPGDVVMADKGERCLQNIRDHPFKTSANFS